MRRAPRRRPGLGLAALFAGTLASGCFGRGAPARSPIVIDPVAGRKSWAMSGLKKKLGDAEFGGTGPVDAEKSTVLASLARRTTELERLRKEREGLRRELKAERARAAAADAASKRAAAKTKRLAARVEELEAERRDLVGRALEADLQRVRVEQQLVEQRLARMDASDEPER